MRCYLDALDPSHDEIRGDLGLELAYVGLSEEKLSVEVGYVDCVYGLLVSHGTRDARSIEVK